MATNIQFVTELWLKDNTPITQNLDIKELYPHFDSAQDTYIKDKLGPGLYTHMETFIDAGVWTPGPELDLLILIRPALAYYIVYDALPFLNAKIRNIGVVETADVKQKNADSAARKELRQEIKNKAELYMQRINDYLCKNYTLFPSYDHSTCSCNCEQGPNKASGFYSDIDLSDDRNSYYGLDRRWMKRYF